MGRILLPDQIGQLSESSGTITLGPSRLTIGGQQYRTTANLDLLVGTATANTLYMIYAVVSSGSVLLVKDTAVNSVGPTGYNSWKLIGAFYSQAVDTFGSFVNIEGAPATQDWILDQDFVVTGSTVNPTNLSTVQRRWMRIGDTLHGNIGVQFSGSSTAGTGTWRFSTPAGFLPNSTVLSVTNNAGTFLTLSGSGYAIDNSATTSDSTRLHFMPLWDIGSSTIVLAGKGLFQLGSGTFPWANGDRVTFNYKMPIDGWSSKPLKDL